jgi:hypothetical protein
MCQPTSDSARFHLAVGASGEDRLAKLWIEQDAGPFAADHQLQSAVCLFSADIQAPSAHQRVPCNECEVQEELGGVFRQAVGRDHPTKVDLVIAAEQALQRCSRFLCIDHRAVSAARSKGQTEELQLVGAGFRALREQLEAAFPHFRVLLVGHQLDTVVERADRRQQVVAKPGTKQTGEIDRVHARLMGEWTTWRNPVEAP